MRFVVGFVAIALVTVGSMLGVRAALHATHSAAAQHPVRAEARHQTAAETRRIVPAAPDTYRGSFFVGTGDGGNGAYVK